MHNPAAFPLKGRTGFRWFSKGASLSLSPQVFFLSSIRYKHQTQQQVIVLSVHKLVACHLKRKTGCQWCTEGASLLSPSFFFSKNSIPSLSLSLSLSFFLSHSNVYPFHALQGSLYPSTNTKQRPRKSHNHVCHRNPSHCLHPPEKHPIKTKCKPKWKCGSKGDEHYHLKNRNEQFTAN